MRSPEENQLKCALEEFWAYCDQQYYCFTASCRGFDLVLSQLHNTPNGQMLFLGHGHPEKVPPVSVVKVDEIRRNCQRDAEFTDTSAKSVIITIFSFWDEYIRPKIARIKGIDTNSVVWDTMGEIRIIRNIVLHDQSNINNDLNCPALGIVFEKGIILLSREKMHNIMKATKSATIRFDNVK